MDYNMEYNESINHELAEKKEKASTNLGLFFGFGGVLSLIFTIVMAYQGMFEGDGGGFIFGVFFFLLCTYFFGSMVIGTRFIFKAGFMPLNLYTLGIVLIIGCCLGIVAAPFMVIHGIYTLCRKY